MSNTKNQARPDVKNISTKLIEIETKKVGGLYKNE